MARPTLNPSQQALLALRLPDVAGWEGWVRHEGVQAACERIALWLVHGGRLWLGSDEPAGKSLLLRLLASEEPQLGYLCIDGHRSAAEQAKELAPYAFWVIDLPAEPPQEALWCAFHLIERAADRPLLVASRRSSAAMAPPELRSRLMAMDFVAMHPPYDDDALRAVLRAELRRRQWEVSDRLIDLLLVHAPRRLEDQIRWLDRLDRQALAERRRVTLPWVRKLLQQDRD